MRYTHHTIYQISWIVDPIKNVFFWHLLSRSSWYSALIISLILLCVVDDLTSVIFLWYVVSVVSLMISRRLALYWVIEVGHPTNCPYLNQCINGVVICIKFICIFITFTWWTWCSTNRTVQRRAQWAAKGPRLLGDILGEYVTINCTRWQWKLYHNNNDKTEINNIITKLLSNNKIIIKLVHDEH